MGILEDEPAAGIRWQIGSSRKASATTWRWEHLVRRGSVETGNADDGAAATWRREHLVRRESVEQNGADDLATGGPRAAGWRRTGEEIDREGDGPCAD
uniref:DUF834 domain-containing protein n=1 Tax=Oryza meridionalis TaxID=40149 RepID=A0A0E0EUP7_9ORYZ